MKCILFISKQLRSIYFIKIPIRYDTNNIRNVCFTILFGIALDKSRYSFFVAVAFTIFSTKTFGIYRNIDC